MSAAVEAAADEPFLTFMRTQVFEPLGMTDTRADSLTEPIPNRATFYFPRFAADPRYGLHLMREIDYSCYAGSSAFLSTPSDLVRFGMAFNGGGLLQRATVQHFQTAQRLASGEETGYGLGWDVETVTLAGKRTRMAGHDGASLGGTTASLWTLPEHGIVIAVTSNIPYANTPALASTIARAFAERGAPGVASAAATGRTSTDARPVGRSGAQSFSAGPSGTIDRGRRCLAAASAARPARTRAAVPGSGTAATSMKKRPESPNRPVSSTRRNCAE